MPSLSDLLRMGKQYISDALPGGSLNSEVSRQSVLDGAAMALSPVPLLGDLVGLGADANRYATDPESRTPMNYGLTALGALPFVPGMTAWHGSPHKFDKFSLDKIGTGEGAQAYGHGLYLAEHPEVATQYSKMFDKNQVPATQLQKLRDAAPKGSAEWSHYDDLMKTGIQGSLYKTDIPDEAVARFLDWDKPLSQQAPEVRSAISALGESRGLGKGLGDKDYQVPDFYRALSNWDVEAKKLAEKNNQAEATNLLQGHGIPGIRYLDGGSRSAGQGSSNFVVFDPEMIRILERNGVPTGQKPWNPNEYRPLSDLMNPRID